MSPQKKYESKNSSPAEQAVLASYDQTTAQNYASGVTGANRLESLEDELEVRTEKQTSTAPTAATARYLRFGSFFSRRKAMVISTLITALVLLITIGAMAVLVRKGPNGDKQNFQTAVQQDVKIENSDNSKIPEELQGAQQSLLVSGDIITRGSLKISDSGFVTVIRMQNPGANQTVLLPGTSGTICLDTNNCGYGNQDDVTALQSQQGSLQAQLDQLSGIINSLGQITIPPAGVTELNGQKGSVSIQGSVNRVSVNTAGGVVTVTTPQDLDANANVQFGNLSLSPSGQIKANTLVQTAAGNSVSINAGSDMITFVAGGRVFSLPTTGGASQTICTTGATCASGSGTAVILSPGVAQVDGTANSSIFINQMGGGSLVTMQSGGTDRFTVSNAGDTTIGGSLTVAGLSNGFVRSTGGSLSVVTAINLSSSDISGILPVANGGTGASTANAARTNLGAAASGTNGDITATTALNTITPSGAFTLGSPAQQFTLQGAGNSSISAGSGANITTLFFAAPSGANTITFPALTGTVCVSTGNCAASGTAGGDLTGSYPNPTIASLQGSSLNITSASTGQVLIYNGSTNRWENTGVSGDIAVSGNGVATIANNAVTTGKIADGNVTNSKLQNSSLTVTAGNGLLNGGSVSLGSMITLNIGQGDGITVGADDIAVDATVCRTTGNCAGVGGVGDITGTGSNGRIALFNGGKSLTSSTLLQSAGNLTLDSGNNFVVTSGNIVLSGGSINVTGGGSFTGTVSGANAALSNEFVTLAQLTGAVGGIDTGVDSLNSLGGSLNLQGTAGQITISDNGSDTITLSLNSAVTLQGNTFNGANQLVRLNSSGQLPVLDGSNLTNLNASSLASGTVDPARVSGSYTGIAGVGTVTTGTWQGAAIADAYLQDNITVNNLGSVDWQALNNYPAACSAGQAITALGDTVTCETFAAGSGSGNYIQNTNSDQNNANFNVRSSNTGYVTAKFRVLAGQTADIIQVRDSADTTTLFSVSPSGGVIAASFTGDGSGLVNLNASNIASGTLDAARIANGSLANNKLANSSLTVTAGGGLVNGGTIALGGTATLNIGQGDGIIVGADDISVDNTVCRVTGVNCPTITGGSGGIGDITGTGTANRLAVFDSAKNITNSYLLQSAGTLTLDSGTSFVLAGGNLTLGSGNLSVTGTGNFTGTVSGANATQNNEFVTLSQLTGAVGGIPGGVSSLNGLAGVLDLQGTTGQITIADNGTDTITLSLGANVTLQGNTFNGASQLVQLDSSGALPILDGSNLTNVNAVTLQGQNGSYYLDLTNATGTLNIARIADASITNAKLVNDSITITAGNGLTGGGTPALGDSTTLNIGAGDGITVNANDIAVDATVARLNANANFTASLQQGGNDVCTTAGNCVGSGGMGDISGSGSANRIAMFSGAKTLAASTLLQSAGNLTLDTGNNFVLTAGNLTLSSGDLSVTGSGSFSGTVTATDFVGSGASLTSLNANELTSGIVAVARISGQYTGISGVGTVTVGTWNGTAISDAYIQDNITISSSGTVDWVALNNYPSPCPAGQAITQLGDTVTCQSFAAGSGSGNYIQNQYTAAQTGSSFWIDGNGRIDGNFTVAGNAALLRNTTNYTATGTQDNVNFGTGSLFRIASAASLTINGISGGNDGRLMTLINASSNPVAIGNNASSTPVNHVVTGTGSTLTVPVGGSVQLAYDSASSVWRVIGVGGVNSVGVFNPANSYANGATISGSSIILGAADASNPGLVTTGAQTFTGAKTINNTLTATQLVSTIATGTAPLQVASTTLVTNLNSDYLDGQHGSYYQNADNINAGTLDDARLSGNVARQNANANFTANLQQGGNDVCTTAGNCAGVGGVGDISGSGNTNRIAMFNGAKTLTSSTLLQSAGNLTLDTGNSFVVSGGNLSVVGSVTATGSLTVGSAGQFVISNLGVVTGGTWNGNALTDGYVSDVLTINSSGNVDWTALNNYPAACSAGQAITQLGDSVTCQTFAAGSGSGNYIQNQSASAQTGSTFWIDGTGRTGGSFRADTSLLSPMLDTASASVLSIGTNNATQINLNQNTVLAAGKSLTVTGGNTASRPGTPTEGMVYYDTTTKRLLTYANGKWQADRSDSILVAASNSSQTDKDAADYVTTGTADQTIINSALTAGSGKKVTLLAGTYTITGSISVPNNTTLSGVGVGTLITIPNSYNTNLNAITNTTTGGNGTGITIRDLKLDGNKANQSSGTMNGIVLNGAGSGTGASAVQGAIIINTASYDWMSNGFALVTSSNNTLINNTAQGNSIYGFTAVSSSSYNTFTTNTARGNSSYGFELNSPNNTITGNTAQGNAEGIHLDGFADGATITNNLIQGSTNNGLYIASDNNRVTNNSVRESGSRGIQISNSNNNIISSNSISNSYGATSNNGIQLTTSDNNTMTGNTINDTDGHSSTNYAINISNSTSDNNYLADNSLGGGTINDAGTGTIHGGQVNGSGNFVIQPTGTIELIANTNVTGTLNISSNVDTNGSLTVGTANQFVINDNGVVTSGTWQGSTLALGYGGTGATTSQGAINNISQLTTAGDLLFHDGTNSTRLGRGTNGQCLVSGATTISWTTCTVASLQSVYDASSPASVLLTDNKNLQFTAADTATDPSIIMRLNCAACGTGATGNFLVQNNSGAALFSIAGNGDIQLGTAANGISLSSAVNGGAFTLSGSARNVKKIRLLAEYPSAVLDADGTGNLGTMTSGYDVSARMNYYKWTTTQLTAQTYDVVIQVPLPADFDGWASGGQMSVSGYTSNTTDGTIGVTVIDSAGTTICSNVAATPGSTGVWSTNTSCSLSSGVYTSGDYISVRIKLRAPTGGDTRVGNIVLNYNSKF